jgi:hypothetical protein
VRRFKSYVCEGLSQQDKTGIRGTPEKEIIEGAVETIERV